MSGMDPVAYTGDGEVWCPDCALEKYGPDPWDIDHPDLRRLDSESNEVAAIFAWGWEADYPQHCAGCNEFLENDLTADGVKYVAEATGEIARQWQDHYGIAGGWSAAPHDDAGKLIAYAWPGGYPVFYVVGDDDNAGTLCVTCAQQVADTPWEYSPDQFRFRSCEVNWEDTDLECDHCYEPIEAAYGEPDNPAPPPVLPGQLTLADNGGTA